MSLPITGVVDVSLTLSPVAKALASFGKLAFVTNEVPKSGTIILQRVYEYGDAKAVGEDWDAASAVVKAANAFYGNGGKDFMVITASAVETSATLYAGKSASLADLQEVTSGGFTISVGGLPQYITGLDFSAVGTVEEVALMLDEEISGVTVTENNGRITIVTTVKGEFASISVASGDIEDCAKILGLTAEAGATVSEARVAETPVKALMDAEDINNSFYGIVLQAIWRDVKASEDVAEYVQARRKVFFNTTNDARTLVTGDTTHILAKLKAKSMGRTLSHYSSKREEYPSAAVAGRAFQVNFEGTNTTITLNLKVMAGVTVENLKTSQHNALVACNGNAVVDIAGMYVYSDSRMGDAQWFDAIHGTDWLQNRIETGVFNRLYTTTGKVPYTDTGVSVILAEVEQALRQGVTNGLLAAGNNTAGEFLPMGYKITYIPTSQVAATDKSNRIYRGISFEAVGAGAMHKVVISGSFNE